MAVIDVFIPQMGEGLQEVCIVGFQKRPGDVVRRDEPLYSMETDKAAMEVESPEVQRYPIQIEWVINQGFEIDHYQPLLFIVDSFEHLFDMVDRLERWMREGKLYNVAPGLPEVNEGDLRSFLEAGDAM